MQKLSSGQHSGTASGRSLMAVALVLTCLLASTAMATIDATEYPLLRYRFSTSTGTQGVPTVVVAEGDQQVTAAVSPEMDTPVALVLAVDVSGSMVPYIAEAVTGVTPFIRSLPGDVAISLITFDSEIRSQTPFTSDREQIVRSLQGLKAAGQRTELYFGIHTAMAMFRGRQRDENRVVVVISDGEDEGGAYTLDVNLEEARAHSIKVIGFGCPRPESTAWRNLERLARETGGVYLDSMSGQQVQVYRERLLGAICQRWVATWATTYPEDGRTRSVVVVVGGHGAQESTLAYQVTMPGSRGILGRPWWHWLVLAGVVVLLGLVLLLARTQRRAEDDLSEGVGMHPVDFSDDIGIAPPTVIVPSAMPVGRAALDVVEATSLTGPVVLHREVTRFGRSADNDVVLDDERLSRHHFTITDGNGVYFIEDLESANGLFVTGERVHGSLALSDGDLIRAGDTVLRFYFVTGGDR